MQPVPPVERSWEIKLAGTAVEYLNVVIAATEEYGNEIYDRCRGLHTHRGRSKICRTLVLQGEGQSYCRFRMYSPLLVG